MDARSLILITTSFPQGEGEPFLHLEMEYLRRHFGRVVVVRIGNGVERPMPPTVLDGVEVREVHLGISPVARLLSLRWLATDLLVRHELQVIAQLYDRTPTLGIIKTMLVSLIKARLLADHLGYVVAAERARGHEPLVYSYWCMEGAMAAALLRTTDPRIVAVTRAHAWDVYFERSSYGYLPFRKMIMQGLDAVFFISQNARQYALALLPGQLDPQRMINARLGIRTSTEQARFTRTYRSFRIVSCSYLIPIKRISKLIDSLALVDGIDVEWVHFGDGPLMPELRLHAKQVLGARGNIRYTFKGRVANWEILQYYASTAVDAFVSVSRYDGIPVSIMEAMSFGIPAIATNVGGVAEIVENGLTGILLRDEPTERQVADAILRLAQMPDADHMLLRQNAKAMWGQFYNADVNYTDFCEALLCLHREPAALS